MSTIGTGLGTINGLFKSRGIDGPWPCSACGETSQYADITARTNRIFCRNPNCDFYRIIDKKTHRIVEPDGTHWEFDNAGNKWQVRPE